MTTIDQLKEDCQVLIEHSRLLRERSAQARAHCATQHANVVKLWQLCRDAQTDAQRIRRLATLTRASEEPGSAAGVMIDALPRTERYEGAM